MTWSICIVKVTYCLLYWSIIDNVSTSLTSLFQIDCPFVHEKSKIENAYHRKNVRKLPDFNMIFLLYLNMSPAALSCQIIFLESSLFWHFCDKITWTYFGHILLVLKGRRWWWFRRWSTFCRKKRSRSISFRSCHKSLSHVWSFHVKFFLFWSNIYGAHEINVTIVVEVVIEYCNQVLQWEILTCVQS